MSVSESNSAACALALSVPAPQGTHTAACLPNCTCGAVNFNMASAIAQSRQFRSNMSLASIFPTANASSSSAPPAHSVGPGAQRPSLGGLLTPAHLAEVRREAAEKDQAAKGAALEQASAASTATTPTAPSNRGRKRKAAPEKPAPPPPKTVRPRVAFGPHVRRPLLPPAPSAPAADDAPSQRTTPALRRAERKASMDEALQVLDQLIPLRASLARKPTLRAAANLQGAWSAHVLKAATRRRPR